MSQPAAPDNWAEATDQLANPPGWQQVPASQNRQIPAPGTTPAGDAAAAGSSTPPGTSDDRKLFEDKASTFEKVSEAGLLAAGGLLNYALGAGTEAFVPDNDDVATIPPPVGRILARRVKMKDDANLSEAGDMIAAGIGLGMWLLKGIIQVVEARLAARRGPQAAQAAQAAEAEPQPPRAAHEIIPGQVIPPQAGPAG